MLILSRVLRLIENYPIPLLTIVQVSGAFDP
jgi:hypothetical protein